MVNTFLNLNMYALLCYKVFTVYHRGEKEGRGGITVSLGEQKL